MRPPSYRILFWILCALLIATVGVFYTYSNSTVPAVFSLSAVCDVAPLDEVTESGDDTVTVRFVAYGDVDGEDDLACGMLPGVRIAVISEEGAYSAFEEENRLLKWWTAVGGDELGIETFIPPGARVPTTAKKLSAAPAQFVTTGSDGIAEMSFAYDRESPRYSLCAISLAGDLIAGCNHNLSLGHLSRRSNYHITVYIYWAHGHAVIETGNSDRYEWFLDGTRSTRTPATVTFEAILGDDIEPDQPYDNVVMIVVDDAHVNAWWAAVSNNGANKLESDILWVGSEALAYDWVHMITTGSDGTAQTAVPPGDYLICSTTTHSGGRLRCLYEYLVSGDHQFEAYFWAGGNAGNIRKSVRLEDPVAFPW